MFFLSMRFYDKNGAVHTVVSEESSDIAELTEIAENVYKVFRQFQMPDPQGIDNNLRHLRFSDAIIEMTEGKITDFDWKFLDKFNRLFRCFITSNI